MNFTTICLHFAISLMFFLHPPRHRWPRLHPLIF